MEELTVDEVIHFHTILLEESSLDEDRGLGGRLVNLGNLKFTIEESNHIADPFRRAAWILYGIVTGHPFVEGNKRIAFQLAALTLVRTPKRYQIVTSSTENNRFLREVAEGSKTRKDVEIWLKSAIKKNR